tara:strand:+ start:725 stop:1855 length:1131 start_codon:yes stop_codon:yes gene_type:complete
MSKDNSFKGDISEAHDFFNANFNSTKYKVSTVGDRLQKPVRHYLDGSDYLANKRKMIISFQHVPSGRSIFFKAFITAFNETYNSDWADEKVYGRTDPIYMFRNTSRKITLGYKVPAGSESEAYENLAKIQQLSQFLYPNYDTVQNAQTISQSPMIRMKVMNLAQRSPDSGEGRSGVDNRDRASPTQIYDSYRSTHASSQGLLGIIQNITINHNLEGEDGAFMKASNTVLPKLFEVNLEFAPIHEKPLGWSKKESGRSEFSDPNFPYNARASDPFSKFADGNNDVKSIIAAAQTGDENQARMDNATAKKTKVIWGLSDSEKASAAAGKSARKSARAHKKDRRETKRESSMGYDIGEQAWDPVGDLGDIAALLNSFND